MLIEQRSGEKRPKSWPGKRLGGIHALSVPMETPFGKINRAISRHGPQKVVGQLGTGHTRHLREKYYPINRGA